MLRPEKRKNKYNDAFPYLIIAIKQDIYAVKNMLIYFFLKSCVRIWSNIAKGLWEINRMHYIENGFLRKINKCYKQQNEVIKM